MTQEQSSKRSLEFLDTLSVKQLRQLLKAEFEADGADVELIRNITTVLASKEETGLQDIDVDSAYKAFVADYSQTEPLFDEVFDEMDGAAAKKVEAKPRRFRFVKIAAAVLAAALVFGALAASASGVNVWTVFTKWTGEIFGYSGAVVDDDPREKADKDEFFEFREALTNHSVSQKVIPNYLPYGYTYWDCDVQNSYEGVLISGLFKNGDDYITLEYLVADITPNMYYPKDEGDPLLYVSHGIEHYITANEGDYRATWINDNVLCILAGVKTEEELLHIIDSIYLEE